jgi:hypothetical protein
VISKFLQILGLQPRISKVFLTVGQNNFGNKIPFLWSQLGKKTCFGPIKSLFSFSTDQAEKISWKKLGENNMVWWFDDVTNKMIIQEKNGVNSVLM